MALHPLDPMSTQKFAATAAILRREHGVDERWRFAGTELAEPSKEDPYAHPVPGLKLIVDMNAGELLEIDEGPARAGAADPLHPGALPGRGAPGRRLAAAACLEGGQPEPDQRARDARGIHAGFRARRSRP